MSILIVCKKMGEILAKPLASSENFVSFNDKDIVNHIKECPDCKKSLNNYYKDQSDNIPFPIKVFADKLFSKFIGD